MWFNSIIGWLLRSPYHKLISGNTVLMEIVGRKSKHIYTVPMNYTKMGDTYYTTSKRTRTWWRNLRGGIEVGIWLQGKKSQAHAEVIENQRDVASTLTHLLHHAPKLASVYSVRSVRKDVQTGFDERDIERSANEIVIVRTTLLPTN